MNDVKIINFSKESRLDLINFIVEKINAKSYLEIGCYEDFVFSQINVPVKIGVDPKQGGNLRMTSDEFFSTNIQKFDVIFVDGLHEYDQAKRDVYNSLKCLNKNGIIIIHDVLPTSRQDTGEFNHGEVYQLSFDLIKEKNLFYKIVKIDWGCGVILPGTQDTKKIKMKRKTVQNWDDYVKYFHKLPIITYDEFTNLLITLEKNKNDII